MADKHPLRTWIEGNTTQAQFARDAGCSEAHLCDVLAGRKGVSLGLAIKMSKLTGEVVSVDVIASRTPSQTPQPGISAAAPISAVSGDAA